MKTDTIPRYPELWQRLAQSNNQLVEATRELRRVAPTMSLVEAARRVKTFHALHTSKHNN